MQKIGLFYLFILEIQPISETHETKLVIPIFDDDQLDQHLIIMDLYQQTKNQTFSMICSEDIDDLKILQSESQKQELSQIMDLCTN